MVRWSVTFFVGAIFWFIGVINGTKLRNRVKKLNPNITIGFFIFIDKKSVERLRKSYPKGQFGIIKVVLSFGSKKIIVDWIDSFMDVTAIKKLNDREVNRYLEKIIWAMSWFVRIFIPFAGTVILSSLIMILGKFIGS